jgi:hypothetical protein
MRSWESARLSRTRAGTDSQGRMDQSAMLQQQG